MPTAARHAIWTCVVWIAMAAGVAFAPTARAQQTDAWVPGKGHGSLSVSYQHLYVRYHSDSEGKRALPGTMRNRSVFLDLDYGLTGRLAISAIVAFKSNKYDGRIPNSGHDPGSLDDDHGQHFLDDGHYHSGWQDWNLALRYLWVDRPHLTVTPFIDYGQPLRNYTVFAHSAVGTGQTQLEAGLNFGGRFGGTARNLFWRTGLAYAYMEKEGDRRVNHGTFDVELGCFVTSRLVVRGVLIRRKTYNGLDFPQDYPDHTNEAFFHHDQNLRDDFLNVGLGAEYQLIDRYTAFANLGHTLNGDNTHLIDYAITVGIARIF